MAGEAVATVALAAGRRPWLGRLLRAAGPAWVVMIADVDAPSVISAGQAGTDFRYATLFPLLLCVPLLYVVQEMTARLGIVTGRGHAELIRERYGAAWAAFAVLAMVAIDLVANVAEFAGIALGASIVGIPPALAIGGALAFHSLWVLTGSYRRFELITVALSASLFAFVALAIAGRPEPAALLSGLSPVQPYADTGYRDLVVALVGASIMPWMIFYQQAATAEKHLAVDDLPAARQETLLSALVSQLLMMAIVVAAATATGATGAASVIPAALAILPGGLARLSAGIPGGFIAIGLIGAGLLAAIVISLSSAWAWCELFGRPHSLGLSPRRAPLFYLVYLLEVVPAAAVALLAPDLVRLVLQAMILNVVVLPVPLAFLTLLASDRAILGARANSRSHSVLLWLLTAGLLGAGLTSFVRVLAP